MKVITKTISISFYGRLKDFLPKKSASVIKHQFIDRTSVKDLIESFNVPHTEVDVILVNGKSVDFSYLIDDGDKVKVYPPAYELNLRNCKRLSKQLKSEPKFVCDVHLGMLARNLRKFGMDVLYNNSYSDETIAQISIQEKRIILTKDVGLLKRKDVRYGYFVRNKNPDKQTIEILKIFPVLKYMNPFSRCLECGSKIRRISRAKAILKLPDHFFEQGMSFYFCSNCDKIYWQGSHLIKMAKELKNLLKFVI